MGKQPEAAKVDLTEFIALSKPKKPLCVLGRAIPELKPADRAALEAALAQDKGIITNAAIRLWLAARGHEVKVQSIVSHRAGSCTCRDA